MSIKSGFFNSLNNDRLYNAEDMSEYFEGLVSNGVYYAVGDALEVSAISGSMSVNVASGRAMIDCRWLRNTADTELEVAAASSTATRVDSVAVKLDTDAREMSLVVVTGGSTAPDLVDTATVKWLRLANLVIATGATQVTAVNDLRGSEDCPWVASVTPSSSIIYYDNVYTTAAASGDFPVGIAEYEPSIDMLEVHVNGIALTPDEYTVNNTGSAATVTFTNGMETGNELWFRVVKSLDYQLSQVVTAEE